jgi:hypothetical protein
MQRTVASRRRTGCAGRRPSREHRRTARSGRGVGGIVAFAFSRDPAQTFTFVVNQNNSRIDIVKRQSSKIVSTLGQIGNLPGQFNQT